MISENPDSPHGWVGRAGVQCPKAASKGTTAMFVTNPEAVNIRNPVPPTLARSIDRIQRALARRKGPRHQRRLTRRLDALLDLAAETTR